MAVGYILVYPKMLCDAMHAQGLMIWLVNVAHQHQSLHCQRLGHEAWLCLSHPQVTQSSGQGHQQGQSRPARQLAQQHAHQAGSHRMPWCPHPQMDQQLHHHQLPVNTFRLLFPLLSQAWEPHINKGISMLLI